MKRGHRFLMVMSERERQMLSALAERYGTSDAEAVRLAVAEQCRAWGIPPMRNLGSEGDQRATANT